MTPEENSGEFVEAAAPVEPTETEIPYDHEPPPERQVPVEALQAERNQRQELQEELKLIKDHLSLMQSQRESQAPKRQEEFDGMSDDDVLTVGEFKKALTTREKQYQMGMEELRVSQQHPDYHEVVTNYLPEVLKSNPGLQRTLETTQDYGLAYHLAKNSDGYRARNKTTKRNADAERIVQNAQQPGSLSAVGQSTNMSEAKRWKSMSDDEFRAAVNKNLGYY